MSKMEDLIVMIIVCFVAVLFLSLAIITLLGDTETFQAIDERIAERIKSNADQHAQHVGSVESVEPTWTKEEHEAFYTFLWNVINPNEMQDYIGMFEAKTEPQTERSE